MKKLSLIYHSLSEKFVYFFAESLVILVQTEEYAINFFVLNILITESYVKSQDLIEIRYTMQSTYSDLIDLII